jgi:hypothetical protein
MTNSQGWIMLYRQFLEWEWYNDTNTKVLFIHLILKANHKDNRYKGRLVQRGTLLTGRSILSKEVGLSEQQVRTSLSKLKSTNEITIESTKQGTVIMIVNYDKYQSATNEVTTEQPTSNQRVTTNNNDNKEKNEKKDSKQVPSWNDFKKWGDEKLIGLGKEPRLYEYDMKARYEAWVENGWRDSTGKEIERWKAKLTNTVPYLKVFEPQAKENETIRIPL